MIIRFSRNPDFSRWVKTMAVGLVLLVAGVRHAAAQTVTIVASDTRPRPVALEQEDTTYLNSSFIDAIGHDETHTVTWDWVLVNVQFTPPGGSTVTLPVNPPSTGSGVDEKDYGGNGGPNGGSYVFRLINSKSSQMELHGAFQAEGDYLATVQATATPPQTRPVSKTNDTDHAAKAGGGATIEMNGVNDKDKQSPGCYVPLNANNDNGSDVTDHIPAHYDFALVDAQKFSDPDLIAFTIGVLPQNATGSVRLSQATSAGARATVRVWDAQTKKTLYQLPHDFPANAMNQGSMTLYLEGSQESGAEREITLTAQKVDAQGTSVGNPDFIKVTVTPVLTKMKVTPATQPAGVRPDYDATTGALESTAHLTQEAVDLEVDAILTNANQDVFGFCQNIHIVNNLTVNKKSVGAITPTNAAGLAWDFKDYSGDPNPRDFAGKTLVDINVTGPMGAPFYYCAPANRGPTLISGTNVTSLVDNDSPKLPVNNQDRVDVTPGLGLSTKVDVTYAFSDFACVAYDVRTPRTREPSEEAVLYFLGNASWSMRFAGTLNRDNNAVLSFAPAPSNGASGSNSFDRSNQKPPAYTTPPAANACDVNWR